MPAVQPIFLVITDQKQLVAYTTLDAFHDYPPRCSCVTGNDDVANAGWAVPVGAGVHQQMIIRAQCWPHTGVVHTQTLPPTQGQQQQLPCDDQPPGSTA